MNPHITLHGGLGLLAGFLLTATTAAEPAEKQPSAKAVQDLFARDRLVAWCIVPFDAKKRGPAERVRMLKRLGIRRFAYDWRAEHLPTFDEEVGLLKKAGIELTAVWFPANLGDDAQKLLAVIKKHGVHPQLWVMMGGGGPAKSTEEQRQKVEQHARALRPIAEAAAKLGCSVALYNHGGWFGEPENQLAILKVLHQPNAGIVYNLHHGHEHLERFPALLAKMKPHLLALNVNGMVKDGDRAGQKILPLGQGSEDLRLLKAIVASGWRGPVGVLGHTQDDAEERLRDNLDGLAWLVPQLLGKPAGPKPVPRTLKKSAADAAPGGGFLAEGKTEYRTPPLVVECVARLTAKNGYNILIACDTKQSAAHWELFTMPGSGHLTAYLPGRKPDHVRTRVDICDGKTHTIGMTLGKEHVRLYVDGKEAASAETRATGGKVAPGRLGFARLVEGGLGCTGKLLRVRLRSGDHIPAGAEDALTVDRDTIGAWRFGAAGSEAPDQSKLRNPARPARFDAANALTPPPGPNLAATDPRLKATLIDRSADDAYMAVKVDGAGRVFVGGREKLFVFEPDGKGGFLPRRELYHFPPDSVIIGLEYRGDDLYVLASHALYLIPGGRVQRERLTPRRILWGVPLDYHVSFHCLAWGPDGQLYLDHGDPLLNYGDWTRPDHWGCWTLYSGPEGKKVPYTGAGAVLKVRPDGEAPRVLARGLRGPVGLTFDRHWNLFTNDNDHESRADLYAPMRLLHVSPQADFAWPRGWMASKSPDRVDLLDSIHPALGRGVPCDLAFYDEPALPQLRGNLLLCRWDRYAVTRYALQPKGASFTAEEQVFAQGAHQCRPTGITVDTTGRVFVTSLYLAGNVVTPHCPSDLVVFTPADSKARPFDETKAAVAELYAALDGPSWEVRRRAHTELLRRGGAALAVTLERLRKVRDSDPAAAHLPWLVAARGGRQATDVLVGLAADRQKPVLRLQSLRALAAFPALVPSAQVFIDPLTYLGTPPTSAPVRLACLEGLLARKTPAPPFTLAKLAAGDDPALRQAAATLLARTATRFELESLARSSFAHARLAAVLAAGIRLTVPLPDAGPPRGVKLHFPRGNGWFNPQLRFADRAEPVDLASLGPIGSYTTAQRWAAGPHSDDEEHLFKLLLGKLDDRDDRVRAQAAYYLGWLRDARSEASIAKVRRELRTRGLTDRPALAVKKVWQLGRLADAAASQALERGPIDLTATITTGGGKQAWQVAAADGGSLPLPAGAGSVYVYFRIQSRSRQPALLSVRADRAAVWHNGRNIPVEADATVLLDLQPGSNDVLLRTTGPAVRALAVRARGMVSIELPEKADGALLAERLRAAKGAALSPRFLAFDWSKEWRKGDAGQGRKLFGSLGCVKCHAITADQTGGGAPSLTEAGKRFTAAHLAESILLPDRQVADEFRATQVVLTDGRVMRGMVVRESPGEIELLLPDTTRRVVRLKMIEERNRLATSPMPTGLVRTPEELRDLLAYLLSERPLPP